MIDLLESDRIKSAIDASPAEVQNTINDSPLAICITAEDHTFTEVNDNYCKLYGYTREELIGQSFLMVVSEAERETVQLLHDKFITEKQEIAREWKVVNKAGQILNISVDAGYTNKLDGNPRKITFIQAE